MNGDRAVEACRFVACDVGGFVVDVAVVADLAALVDAQALLRDVEPEEPPYWAHLWVGSRALARHVAAQRPRAERAIDIGCGVGLAGLTAAHLGIATTFVDRSVEALTFVRASARHANYDVQLVQTDLLAPGLRGRFPLCLAADVTYDPALQVGLAQFLAEHLAPNGIAWCAESVRTADRGFLDACSERGLRATSWQVVEEDEGVPVVLRLLEVGWATGAILTGRRGSAQSACG